MAIQTFWQFFLVWGVVVALGSGAVGSVLTAAVSTRWFVARRGLALGILGSANSTGQLVFLPLLMAAMTFAGWRIGSMLVAGVAIALLPLVYLWMRDDPADVGLLPYGVAAPDPATTGTAAVVAASGAATASVTVREVVAHPTFWLLAASFFICGGTANGLIGTHLIPHEIDHGVPELTAASLVGLMGGLNFVGTILSGWMIDRVEPRRWLALVYALRGVSLFTLPFVADVDGMLVFAVIYGLDWFASVPPTMAITADTFGRQNVGKVYGWIYLSHQIGAALMAAAAGVLRTWFGDYQLAFLAGGVIALIAAGIALQTKPPGVRVSAKRATPEIAGA
jgi:sugar phosphate permease